MKVTIDRELCIGAGNCVRLAPESFDQDEEAVGVPLADDYPEELRPLLMRVQAECPSRAITVID
jgi:ferredoxin